MVSLSLWHTAAGPVATGGGGAFRIQGATLTDQGQVREGNEDSVYLEPSDSSEALARGVLCVVADGMGGSAAGEVASRLAIQGVRNRYYAGTSTFIAEALRSAIESTNLEVFQYAQREPQTSGMGCTLTAAVVLGDDLVVGHVGDSRAYLVHDSGIVQITRDHSWVEEQVDRHVLTREQANHHPQRNVILRALGPRSTVAVDIIQHKLVDRDVVVLCSDGLSTLVSDEEIARSASVSRPDQTVAYLVALANERGAPDNVTVAALQVHGPEPNPARSRLRLNGWWPPVAALAVALVLGAALTFTVISQTAPAIDAATAATDTPTAAGTQSSAATGTEDAVIATPPAGEPSAESPSVTAASGEIAYMSSTANLRSTPDLGQAEANVSGRLMEGQAVVIDGTRTDGPLPEGESLSIWYHVHLPTPDALSGWVWAGNVRRGSASPAPATPGLPRP